VPPSLKVTKRTIVDFLLESRADMYAARTWVALVVGTQFLLATVGLLAVLASERLSRFEPILVILTGMTAFAAIMTLIEVAGRQERSRTLAPPDEVWFNEDMLSASVYESVKTLEEARDDTLVSQGHVGWTPQWELTAGDLVAVDNALALAKLRMDLEQQLRQLAYFNDIDVRLRPIGVLGLAEELMRKEVLPIELRGALRDVVSVCNQAIHGGNVQDDVAASVVRVGGQLLEAIQAAMPVGGSVDEEEEEEDEKLPIALPPGGA
jgi:hypothetical protein